MRELRGQKKKIREEFRRKLPELYQRIQSGEEINNGDRQLLIEMCISALGKEKDGTASNAQEKNGDEYKDISN